MRSSYLLLAAACALAAPLLAASCTGDTTNPIVRSLERTGKVAFICLGAPGSDAALRPLGECSTTPRESPADFGTDESATHVYALVTLETRGEVAVVDVTSTTSNVLDQDPSTPGENSLPVGAQPVDIVATPKGTAAFVASAEVARPALYALPAELIRPCEADSDRCAESPPSLSTWPSCVLPSPPGAMVMVADPPAESGSVRQGCDGDYAPVEGEGPTFGDIDREGLGRQKLYIALPREGRVVVIDAQSLLERPGGEFAECPIERSLELSSQVTPIEPDPIPDGLACAVPPVVEPTAVVDRPSIPAGFALVQPEGGSPGASGARLYVADLGLPLIHMIDLADPCEPQEGSPLLPTSLEDPSRVVISDRIAVSRVTPEQRRYLYAIDVEDKSVMSFDVSDVGGDPRPLRAARPELNPFQPPDRVRFASAPVDVSIMQRDRPESAGATVAPIGTLCDPDRNADPCTLESTTCDIGTLYRTSSDYETGAGPFTLRGVFGVVALSSGQLAVIDIEDFDAPCRGPKFPVEAFGCAENSSEELITSNEPSCGMVIPHQPRSAYYLLSTDEVGRHEPGLQSFPVLSLDDGTVILDGPVLRAPIPATVPENSTELRLAVGGDVLNVEAGGAVVDDEGLRNTILFNFANPRVHQSDQEWSLRYQGPLPGFDAKVGDLQLLNGLFLDTTARFCDRGVQSREAVRLALEEEGIEEPEQSAQAARYADRLHVLEPLADTEDPYWDGASCSFADCRATFGDAAVPTAARDVIIEEATQDRLTLGAPSGTTAELFECCFPTLVDYEVRPGDEWILVGNGSGFIHSVIADEAAGGVCRPSCDPRLSLRDARVRHVVGPTESTVVEEVDPLAFKNALFRFAIVVPDLGSGELFLERDMTFRFITQASFVPIRGALTTEQRPSVQVQEVGYLPVTDEVFATDGFLEGLLLVPGDLIGDIRQFY